MKNLIPFLSLLFLLGCNSKVKTPQEKKKTVEPVDKIEYPQIINIGKDFKNSKELRLSEIADDIEYIKLEKTPESLVGGGNPGWYVTSEYIFVYSQNKLLQFDRLGKFIKQFGRNGRGPGEFQSMKGMVADESKNILYVIANFKHVVLMYDLITGEFLGNFPVNDYLGAAIMNRPIQMLGKDTFIVLTHPFAKFKPDYSIFEIIDNKGNVLNKRKSSLFSFQADKNVRRIPNGNNQIWFFNNQFRFYEGLNDTVYNFKDFKLEPVYIFDLGKYKGPFEEMTTKFFKEIPGYILLVSFWETQKYLLFGFLYNGKSQRGFYDKTEGKFYRLTPAEDIQEGIINDIDGGLSFWPSHSVEHSDREWIYWFDAIELKQKLTEEYLGISEAKYLGKKENLKRFMKGLLVDDNPIIFEVKLKE
ncbi:6-bladed beta-propeller [Maribellus comscasis]|uniref:6-bladed beta-propeller n=1 Tax=Maribellus comscasis TaxID=2681766 RepID=A0A6I6K5S4_9BACT|nr:6-bladed beta-propeller [Maribellus comscasis]QGY46983.1 6-bladed beta-propeller [Maribellus comscasis]